MVCWIYSWFIPSYCCFTSINNSRDICHCRWQAYPWCCWLTPANIMMNSADASCRRIRNISAGLLSILCVTFAAAARLMPVRLTAVVWLIPFLRTASLIIKLLPVLRLGTARVIPIFRLSFAAAWLPGILSSLSLDSVSAGFLGILSIAVCVRFACSSAVYRKTSCFIFGVWLSALVFNPGSCAVFSLSDLWVFFRIISLLLL